MLLACSWPASALARVGEADWSELFAEALRGLPWLAAWGNIDRTTRAKQSSQINGLKACEVHFTVPARPGTRFMATATTTDSTGTARMACGIRRGSTIWTYTFQLDRKPCPQSFSFHPAVQLPVRLQYHIPVQVSFGTSQPVTNTNIPGFLPGISAFQGFLWLFHHLGFQEQFSIWRV